MNDFKLFTNENVILFAMLLVTMYLIHNMYKTSVTSKSIIITMYLYIMVALLFIALMAKYTQTLAITNREHIFQMIILYFVLGISGISMMTSDKMFVSHVGFLLLLLALSLTIGSTYRYSSNVTQAATITAIIVGVLTLVVFTSSEERLMTMKEWLPNLMWILMCVIIMELGYLALFDYNQTFYRIIALTVIALFGFFVLSDTSRLILESKSTLCQIHSCINYPLKSSQLMLDYINIFIQLVKPN